MKRGVLIIAGIAVLLVVVFVVVTLLNRGGETGPKVLSVYLPFDEVKVYEKISAEFVAANPGVELKFKYIDAKDAKEYEAKVVNEIADGAGPDIWLVRSDWIPKHAAKTTPYLNTQEEIDSLKTVIEPAVVDLNTFDKKVYGIPLFADTLAVFYNLTAINNLIPSMSDTEIDEVKSDPRTWSIIKRQAEILTKKSGSVIQRSGLAVGTVETGYAPVDVYSALLLQNKGSLFSDDGNQVSLNLAQFISGKSFFPATSALKLFYSFTNVKEKNYSWNNDLGEAESAFVSGKALVIIGYRSLLNEILSTKPKFSIGVAALPQLSEKSSDRIDYGVSWSHLINGNTPNPILAKAYFDYLAKPAVQNSYTIQTNKTSVETTEGAGGSLSGIVDGDNAGELFRTELRAITQLYKPEWQKTDEIIQDMIKSVVNSKQSAQSAVDSAAVRLKELL